MRCRYNVVNFLQNHYKRHPIARPLWRGMGCLCVLKLCFLFCLRHCNDVCKLCYIRSGDDGPWLHLNRINHSASFPKYWSILIPIKRQYYRCQHCICNYIYIYIYTYIYTYIYIYIYIVKWCELVCLRKFTLTLKDPVRVQRFSL